MQPSDAVALSLGGCDFGDSGVSVFARAMLPRLIDVCQARGRRVIVIGTQREREASGLVREPGPVLPASANRPGVSAAVSLTVLAGLARVSGAGVLYLPCANRRITGIAPIPVVGTVHDLAQFYVADKYGRLRQLYVQRLLVPLLRRLKLVTAVSQATADDIVKFAGVAPARIRVIPNGTSISRPATQAASTGRPFFFYPARLEHPGKNHLRLLEGFSRSRARQSHDLVLSGADWGARAMIEEKLRELQLGDRVRILGFVERDQFASYMSACDAVVAAGLREGFGLPAVEGMVFGKVIVASNTGSLPEVVGEMGASFDPLDPDSIAKGLDRAVGDQALRELCRAQGPARASRFSWDTAAERTAAALDEAMHAAA